MKSLNGKELKRGDAVIFQVGVGDQSVVMVGNIQQFDDRHGLIRVSGYALPIKADGVVLASDAWEDFAAPLLTAKAKADDKKQAADAKVATAEVDSKGTESAVQ